MKSISLGIKDSESNISIAKAMREFAKEHRASELKRWRDDPEMVKMFLDDCSSYREIARLIRADKITEAYYKASSLDTAAREEIPEDIWNFLSNNR